VPALVLTTTATVTTRSGPVNDVARHSMGIDELRERIFRERKFPALRARLAWGIT